ncbi:hypothetical protein TIFTF001_041424 [Ficus carica]|uniref:Uncharacterized protein n=1 Tax=Ficus carica TaxID=3494 RepID=A0AA88D8N5_FICCA|nr:hypothetical protein TIFTF001_041424 [Ficus carica]
MALHVIIKEKCDKGKAICVRGDDDLNSNGGDALGFHDDYFGCQINEEIPFVARFVPTELLDSYEHSLQICTTSTPINERITGFNPSWFFTFSILASACIATTLSCPYSPPSLIHSSYIDKCIRKRIDAKISGGLDVGREAGEKIGAKSRGVFDKGKGVVDVAAELVVVEGEEEEEEGVVGACGAVSRSSTASFRVATAAEVEAVDLGSHFWGEGMRRKKKKKRRKEGRKGRTSFYNVLERERVATGRYGSITGNQTKPPRKAFYKLLARSEVITVMTGPVITVMTVTLVHDDRERDHNCYDHHGILVPETATYVDLIQLVRSIIGISRLDKTIVMRYVVEPGLPPVRIQCDADVKFYIQLKKNDVYVLSKFPITIDVLEESGAEAMPPDVGESNHIDVHPSWVGGQSDEAIQPVVDDPIISDHRTTFSARIAAALGTLIWPRRR